jgi:hypothetical protein
MSEPQTFDLGSFPLGLQSNNVPDFPPFFVHYAITTSFSSNYIPIFTRTIGSPSRVEPRLQ